MWSIRMPSIGALVGLSRNPSCSRNAVKSGGASLPAASDDQNLGFEVELQVETLGEERLQHEADLLLLLIAR